MSDLREPTCAGYCGSLGWTAQRYGRVTHKQSCPHRCEPWCQSHPGRCPEDCVPEGSEVGTPPPEEQT